MLIRKFLRMSFLFIVSFICALVILISFRSTGSTPPKTFTNYGYEDVTQQTSWGEIHARMHGTDHEDATGSGEWSSPYQLLLWTTFAPSSVPIKGCTVELHSMQFVAGTQIIPVVSDSIGKLQMPFRDSNDGQYGVDFRFDKISMPYEDVHLNYEIIITGCPENKTAEGTLDIAKKLDRKNITFWDVLMGI